MAIETVNTRSILEVYPIGSTRRNHGLEHATLHLLSRRHPRQSLAGHSDPAGFWIMGDVSGEEVKAVAQEALQRLRSGERQLAVHPHCGTNYATAGILAGLAGALPMFTAGQSWRAKLERLPLALTLSTLALLVAQPLGALLQRRLTTSSDPGSLQVAEVRTYQRGRFRAHRVVTQELP